MELFKNLFQGNEPAFPPSDSTPEVASDLLLVEQMADELVDYLLGDRLFRQIVVETPKGTRRPKMTLGSLWEQINQLQADENLGENDRVRLLHVREAWQTARRRYPDQFDEKLGRELQSFLHSWQYFLRQGSSNREKWREDYAVEIRNRHRVETVLYLLGPKAPAGILDDLEALERSVRQ